MAYVYIYIDKNDEIIKYVGIVWSDNRTLAQRIKEHKINDEWCTGREWRIEYIKTPITNRTDAEYFEAHYVSLFGTDKWYNIRKAGWGISDYLPTRSDWANIEDLCKIKNNDKEIAKLSKTISKQNDYIKKLEETILELQDSNVSYRNITYDYYDGLCKTLEYINGFKKIVNQYEKEIKTKDINPAKIDKKKDKMIYILNNLHDDINEMLEDKQLKGA